MSYCGEISVIGLANAGKSTLINTIVQHKASIVTRKRNTTNRVIKVVYTASSVQIIFIDTPGVFTNCAQYSRQLSVVKQQLNNTDFIALVVDAASGFKSGHGHLINILRSFSKRIYCILNKIDLIPKGNLLFLSRDFNDFYPFYRTFMVSALKNDGVQSMLSTMRTDMPSGGYKYKDTILTDLRFDVWLAEITREAILDRIHDEIPYTVKISTTDYVQQSGSWVVNQDIIVARDGHKAILLGSKGEVIKHIGIRARKQMSKLLNKPVNLFLQVLCSKLS